MSAAQTVGLIAAVAFLLISTSTSLRLLNLWRKTRQAPELLIGLGLLGTGPLGFGLSIGAELMASQEIAAIIRLIGSVTVSLACLCFYAFTAVVFRPGMKWARAFSGAAAIGFAVLFAISLHDHLALGANRIDPAVIARSGLLGIGWAWMGFECVRYWRMASRRAELGLADPIVVNRFFLWGVVSIESVVNVTSSTLLAIRDGGHVSDSSILIGAILGLIGSVALLLAFLPPAGYRAWVGARWESSHGRT